MDCYKCKGTNCTEINITLKGDEQSIKFYSCGRCETKWWMREGDELALDEFLTLTAQHEGK